MHKFFVSKDMINSNNIKITGEDAEHIIRVLRLRIGEKIQVSDGSENEFICEISAVDKKSVLSTIVEKMEIMTEPLVKVDLYQGMPKGVKMDLIVQKCTELGVNAIIPVDTERVIVKLNNDKDMENKITRWKRISQEAAKQSNRGRIPVISNPIKFNEAIDRFKDYDLVLIPYEKEDKNGLKQILKGQNNINSIVVFIGPEGGFSEDEINIARDNGAAPVTLGPRILRTETAGFTCLAIINYELGDIGGKVWEK